MNSFIKVKIFDRKEIFTSQYRFISVSHITQFYSDVIDGHDVVIINLGQSSMCVDMKIDDFIEAYSASVIVLCGPEDCYNE
jgi:methyl coenzyme M reductase subunit C-like uncharacterized protein (methanogenesis marker protein 7)